MGEPVIRREPIHVAVPPHDRALVSLAKPGSRCGERVEHCLELKGGAADDFKHVGDCGLLLQRLAQFIQQSDVVDRDRCLVGKSLNQGDLLVTERPDVVQGINAHDTEQIIPFKYRH